MFGALTRYRGTVILGLVGCAFVWFMLAQRQGLRNAGLIKGKHQLLLALDEYNKSGTVTNYPTASIQVWLSTKVVNIRGTQYHCFAEAGGGWGYDRGTLAMTTNKIFIWLDTERPPKIITNGYRPPFFSTRF